MIHKHRSCIFYYFLVDTKNDYEYCCCCCFCKSEIQVCIHWIASSQPALPRTKPGNDEYYCWFCVLLYCRCCTAVHAFVVRRFILSTYRPSTQRSHARRWWWRVCVFASQTIYSDSRLSSRSTTAVVVEKTRLCTSIMALVYRRVHTTYVHSRVVAVRIHLWSILTGLLFCAIDLQDTGVVDCCILRVSYSCCGGGRMVFFGCPTTYRRRSLPPFAPLSSLQLLQKNKSSEKQFSHRVVRSDTSLPVATRPPLCILDRAEFSPKIAACLRTNECTNER